MHTVGRKDKGKPIGLLWYGRATYHFIMAQNRNGKNKQTKHYINVPHTR